MPRESVEKPERDGGFLWDMLDAIQAIQRFLDGKSEADLGDDELVQAAVSWQIIVVGEAARRVSRQFREAHPEIDWQLLFSQRNFYAHEYDYVEAQDMWAFVSRHLPLIAAALPPLLPPLPPSFEN